MGLLRDRAGAAVRLLGAFLTLEDEYDVDWEFPGGAPGVPGAWAPLTDSHPHPHRRPARASRRATRRAGALAPAVTPCLSPLPLRPHRSTRHDVPAPASAPRH